MMKKVLSVALSVIMVLSLIAVPGFAADPTASVEYTVSAVSYSAENRYYDDANPEADADGYVTVVEPATAVPANGGKLTASVSVSASAASTATAIFAVYTDGVLTNAFYDTKAVGADAVEFSKEMTVADSTKETYKVFVLGADGKAIAPASSFPEAENAMEYIVISYADGTADKYYGADMEGDTIVSAISAERKVANPSIKVVPVDNTTVVTIDIAADFWTNGATVKLTAIDGTEVTYTIMSDMIKASFTPVLDNKFAFAGAALKKTRVTPTKQSFSFEAAESVVNVTVPYGTASLNLDPIVIYENGVKQQSAAEEISMDGADVKEYTVGVGSKEYKFVFKWDDSAPYVSAVKFGGGYPARSIVVRADGASTVGYSSDIGSNIANTTANVATSKTLANAGVANSELTVNGTAIPNNANLTVLALAKEDNFVRSDMINYSQPNWVHMNENEAWTTFKVSEPATVYVKMSHANAAEADFVWPEGEAAGWTKATSATESSASIVVYYKTFAAGETVNVPSQTVTEAELAFVNAKLATAYPASATEVGSVQFQYQKADEGAQLYYKLLGEGGWSEWTAHPTGKNDGTTSVTLNGKKHRGMYYRNTADHGLSIGAYGSSVFVAVAFNSTPGEGGGTTPDPDDPTPDTPDEPTAPKLSWTSALALTSAAKTQDAAAVNTDLYSNGLYGLGTKSGEIELNPAETTVTLEVPYGVEVVSLNGGAKIDLLGDEDHAVQTTVTVNEVEYTVNVAWAAYAYEAGMPMLYDLAYYVSGKTNLAGAGDWYYAVPSNLVLNADMDVVLGEGDLKGTNGTTQDLTVDQPEGTWFTFASQKKGNYAVVKSGGTINRLRIAPSGFRTFTEAGMIENNYAFNGATTIVTHYQDAASGTVVSPRFTFKSAVKGYVIAGYNKAQTLGEDWTKLDGVKVETTNASTTAAGTALQNPPTGHTNPATSYGIWFNGYDHVYVKPVNAGDAVAINETAVTGDMPPFVMVVTEDMIDIDVEIPDAPVVPDEPDTPVEPEDPTPAETKLASLTFSTAAHTRFTEAATETGATQTWGEDATEYVVKVPIGTGTVTVTAAADDAETPNTLASDVVVDMAGKDEATAEVLGFTVKFVWDNTDPYITDVVVNAAFAGRWGVDSGADGDLTAMAKKETDTGALSTDPLAGLFREGETAPAVTKYVYSIATHSMNGQPHMATTPFGMRDTAYEGTTAANSLLSFKVSAPATVYVRAVAVNGVWEELADAGWSTAGTLGGDTLYKKEFAAGDYVYLPGTPVDDAEAAGYNAANTATRYVKYIPTETVTTTTGDKTQADAFADIKSLKEGYYFKWSVADGVLVAPMTDASNNALTVQRLADPVFYVQFEAPVIPTLASYTVTTTKSAVHQDVVAVTDEAGTFEGEEYTIVVPVGTASATAVLTENTEETATVEVDFAGLDAAETTVTVGENEYTVKFVWDDTNPYFYNTVFADKDASKQTKYGHERHNIQYGNLAEMLYDGGAKPNTVAGKALYGENTEYTFVGVPAPEATADTVVLGIPSAVSGQAHMPRSNFFMLDKAFPANDASDAFASFQVGAAGTIYVKSPANAGVWPEMDALVADENSGWYRVTYVDGDETKNATIRGFAVYAIDVEKGDTVAIPGAQLTDEYMAAYNASLAERGVSTRYYKFTSLDETIVTASGEMTWADACVAANVTNTSRLYAGVWYEWGWDATANLPTLPVRYNNDAPVVRFATHSQLLVYGYFGDYEYVPEAPVEPEIPPEEPGEEPVVLSDIEDGGAVLAVVEADLDVEQDAASSDVTVEGNKGEEARGTEVIAFVLADGVTLAQVQAALATPGTGDLVAAGLVLAMGAATVDENGDYAIDLTLPASVTSGEYDVVIDDEAHEDALVFTAIAEKVAAYNAIVTGAANPFADVDLIIATADIYAGLGAEGQAAVEASVLAKDAVAALPTITETAPGSGEYVGLENIATLAAIIDTRIAVEALNDGADAAELALVWNYILPAADVASDDIAAVAGAIYTDAEALNATGKANAVAAIAGQDYETVTENAVQVSVKAQVQADFAEAAFVELINNTGYSNINNVAALVNKYIAAGVFEDLTSVSTTTLSTIIRDYTITSYADFEAKVAIVEGGSDTPVTGGTEVVPSTPSVNNNPTSGTMSSTTTGGKDEPTPVPSKKKLSDFKDAADAAWASTALQMMLDREILSGYEDDTIRPNNNATRQEVAKMLVEAFSEVRAGAWTGFADVPADSWYYSYVATAAEDGIIKGVSATDFGTDAMITREDLSVLIYRFLVSKGIKLDTNANKVFTDAANISDYATDAINALSNAGVINGYEDGSFNPKGNATRAEIAQVIANVLVLYAL